jgi:hypothetical protein
MNSPLLENWQRLCETGKQNKDNEIEDMKNRATELEAALKIQDQGIKYE